MSYKALVEICLNVHSFRNISLTYNGVYSFRFKIYRQKGNKRELAFPYAITRCFIPELISLNLGTEKLITESNEFAEKKSSNPAYIDEIRNEAFSSAVAISHIEGDCDIEELIMFRLELDVFDFIDDTDVFLEVDMLFHENDLQNPVFKKKSEGENLENVLCTQKYRLHNLKKGIHEYIAGNFHGSNYSILNMTIHSVLTEYRYRIINKPITEITEAEIYKYIFDPKSIPDNQRRESMQSYIMRKLRGEDLEAFCMRMINKLKLQHDLLLRMYTLIYNKCLFDKHKKKFGDYLQDKPLKLEIPDPLKDPEFLNSLKEFKIDVETIKNFTKQLPEERLSNFMIEVGFISGEILYLWHKYLDLIRISPKFVCTFFEFDYLDKIKKKWLSYLKTTIIKNHELTMRVDNAIYNDALPLSTMKMSPFNEPTVMNVVDCENFEDTSLFPEVKEQIFNTSGHHFNGGNIIQADDNYKGIHLVVLVHGFLGNSFDMKLLKNNLLLLRPELLIYCSQRNEDNTEGNINDMGKILAEEVTEYIRDFCPGSALGRMSFIGYSLGGIITRAALPHLKAFLNKFYTYMTLSTPHISFLYSSSTLVDAGMWLLKKLKTKSDALKQLTMSDSSSLNQTVLYKLSQITEISSFKNVLFFGSPLDTYCPYDSAVILVTEKILRDKRGKGATYQQMVANIMGNIKANNVFRVCINYNNIKKGNLDSFLGRAAHILYLESDLLVKMIMSRYESCFC